ncbi:MAG: helix-turn-helix domain-containing protein [Candidatus Magasanikbacteria bacterium]|nr:helix-turn-helix domain-containing protein [Candidatus Magasanikbacteria bacterium]
MAIIPPIDTQKIDTAVSRENEPKKEIIRVSISEAARLFGVSQQTIRRAIKMQEIVYVVVGGRYKINFESLVQWSQAKTTVRNKSNENGIGQYVDKWKIRNTLYSPSKRSVAKAEDASQHTDTKQNPPPSGSPVSNPFAPKPPQQPEATEPKEVKPLFI